MTLKVERSGMVVILVPAKTPKEEIRHFFQSKVPWINKKLSEFKEGSENLREPRKYTSGETFPYLGEEFRLEIVEGRASGLVLSHGIFVLTADGAPVDGRELFLRWYRERAHEIFTERALFYGRQLGIELKSIRITSARTRYGSCSWDDRLSFSYRLVMAPYSVIDYIVVHELAHVRIKNHSKNFWDYIEDIMPDYRERKNWLKKYGHTLEI